MSVKEMLKKCCGNCHHRDVLFYNQDYCRKKHDYEEFREKPTYKYPQNDPRSKGGLQFFDGVGCTDWKKSRKHELMLEEMERNLKGKNKELFAKFYSRMNELRSR